MRDLHTNYKKSSLTIIIVTLVMLTGLTAGALRLLNGAEERPQKTASSSSTTRVQPATTVRYTAEAGKTVLEQLKNAVDGVAVKSSEYGEYVESINGVKAGTDNKYWSYYVNGQMANIGAGEYRTEGGEEIVWKFE